MFSIPLGNGKTLDISFLVLLLVALAAVIVLRKNATVKVLDITVTIMAAQTTYKVIALVMLFIGGLGSYVAVWAMSDVGIALMTVFNAIAIIPMCGEALKILKEFEVKKKQK